MTFFYFRGSMLRMSGNSSGCRQARLPGSLSDCCTGQPIGSLPGCCTAQAVFNQRARLNLAGNIHINKNRFGIPEDIQREDLRNDLLTHPGKKLRTAFPFPGSDDPPELFLLIGDPRLDLSAHVFVHVFLSFLYWHPAG